MLRLSDFDCNDCGKRYEATLEEAEDFPPCPECKSENVQRVFSFGGYSIRGNNGASVRPVGSGCFKGRKA